MDAQLEIVRLKGELAARDEQLAKLSKQNEQLAKQSEQLSKQNEQLSKQSEQVATQAMRIAELEHSVATLEELVRKQMEMLGRNSGNSNKPPSSDGPGTSGGPAKRPKKRKGRKRGGQSGHKGSHRRLLSPEQVDDFVDLFPPECRNCWAQLPQIADVAVKRYQYTELMPLMPRVTEYRRQRVLCRDCGHKTRADYDTDTIPNTAFGPRLMAVVALLTGVYHLSRRKAAKLLWELLGVRISLGTISNIERSVSNAVAAPVDEAWAEAMRAPVKHTDGTSWLQSGLMRSLWVVATTAVTVFKVIANGRASTLKAKILTSLQGILVSDRATALKFWSMHKRQICWAHLLRKFVSFSERDGPTGTRGRELLDAAGIVFTLWADFKNGTLTREQFVACIAPVRADFETTLQRAVAADIKDFSGSCSDMWDHRNALWTFVDQDGVEPTNNHAERELRAFVLWRKRSFGTQSCRGNLFAERVMTIAHTARKQGKSVIEFLTACCTRSADEPAPSLFDTSTAIAPA